MKVLRWFSSAGLAIAMLLTFAPAARASSVVNVLIRRQPDAPLRIDDCKAYINDTDVGNVNYYLDIAADYTNVDPQKRGIAAVRLQFDVFDDFYDDLRTVYGNDSDPIAADSAGERMGHDTPFEQFIAHRGNATPVFTPTWEFINTNDTAKNIICSVATIRFEDGSLWNAPSRPFTQAGVDKAFQEYLRTPQAGELYTVVSHEFLEHQLNP